MNIDSTSGVSKGARLLLAGLAVMLLTVGLAGCDDKNVAPPLDQPKNPQANVETR